MKNCPFALLLIRLLPALLVVTGCNDQSSPAATQDRPISHPDAAIDITCDIAEYPSASWSDCELGNWQRSGEALIEQQAPAFVQRSLAQQGANLASLLERFAQDSSWGLPPALLNTPATPLCAAGMGPCVGDPFRYTGVDGADGSRFYEGEAEVVPVVYYDRDCARISGRVWRPRDAAPTQRLPAVVIKNGSVQAGEQLYWWAAQALVRAGYVVLTGDPRGQGRSDGATPQGGQGGNINGAVFFEGLVDDIDFLLSSPQRPYPHEAACAGTYPTETTLFNPLHAYVDAERIGIAGHSYGAGGATWVQSYGAPGAAPWSGQLTLHNPVRAIVAWDALGSIETPVSATVSNLMSTSRSPFQALLRPDAAPPVVPQVPALGFSSEYGFTPLPFAADPERSAFLAAFEDWRAAGVPVYQLAIAGSTHLDFSLGPKLPATSWCPQLVENACVGGWARPAITHYTVAWFDRWLKRAGEPGYSDADARLLDDVSWAERWSFHYASARFFTTRDGQQIDCADIRLGCVPP